MTYYNAEEFQRQIEQAGATFHAYPAGTLTSNDISVATQSGDLTRVPGEVLRATELLAAFLLDELPASNQMSLSLMQIVRFENVRNRSE